MKIGNESHRTIWFNRSDASVIILDQTKLPDKVLFKKLRSLADVVRAIKNMEVRGAPLIGVTALYGVFLGMKDGVTLEASCKILSSTRPTAHNLFHMMNLVKDLYPQTPEEALSIANEYAERDVRSNRQIAFNGATELYQLYNDRKDKTGPLNIMTHCNAGWLATVDWGTALAPIFKLTRS